MTFAELAQLLTALAAVVGAIGTFVNGRNIKRVEKQTNHIKDELVIEVRKAATLQGRQDEKDTPSG